jgi:hypothetical protein
MGGKPPFTGNSVPLVVVPNLTIPPVTEGTVDTPINESPLLTPGAGWGGSTSTPSATGSSAAAAYDQPVIAQWTVPYKEVVESNGVFVKDNQYYVSLQAHHFHGINRVVMGVDGGTYRDAYLGLNPTDNRLTEWHARISLTGLSEGIHEVRAIVYPNIGSPMVIQGRGTTGFTNEDRYGIGADRVKKSHLFYHRLSNGAYATRERYVSVSGNDSTGTGTFAAPYATVGKALLSLSGAESGGKIYLSSGDHLWDLRPLLNTAGTGYISGLPWYGRSFPVTIQPYVGLTQATLLDVINSTGGLSGNAIGNTTSGLKIHSLELRNLYMPRVRQPREGVDTWQHVPYFKFPSPTEGAGYGEASFVIKGSKAINLLGITMSSDGTNQLRWVWDEVPSRLLPITNEEDGYSRFVSYVDVWQENNPEAKLPRYLARNCVVRNSNSSQIYGIPRCSVGNYITGLGKRTDGVRWYARPWGGLTSADSVPNDQHTDVWQFVPYGFNGLTGGFGSLAASIRGTNTAVTGPASASWSTCKNTEALEFVPYDYLLGLTAGPSLNCQNFLGVAMSQIVFDGNSEIIELTGCGPNNAYTGTYKMNRNSIVFDANSFYRLDQASTFITIGTAESNTTPRTSNNGGVVCWPRNMHCDFRNFLWKNNKHGGGSVNFNCDPSYLANGNISGDMSKGCLFDNNYTVEMVRYTGHTIGVVGGISIGSIGGITANTNADAVTGSAETPDWIWGRDTGYPGKSLNRVDPNYMPFRSPKSGVWYNHGGWTGHSTPLNMDVVVVTDQGNAIVGQTVSVTPSVGDRVLSGQLATSPLVAGLIDMDYIHPYQGRRVLQDLKYQWIRRVEVTGENGEVVGNIDVPISGASGSDYTVTSADADESISSIYCRVEAINYRENRDGSPGRSAIGKSVDFSVGQVVNNPVTNAHSTRWTVNVSTEVTQQLVYGLPSTWVQKTKSDFTSFTGGVSGQSGYRNRTFQYHSSGCTTNSAGQYVKPVQLAYIPQGNSEPAFNGPSPWITVTALTGGNLGVAVLYYTGITSQPNQYGARIYQGTANCEFPNFSNSAVNNYGIQGWRIQGYDQAPSQLTGLWP